jgi:hypothetical protein
VAKILERSSLVTAAQPHGLRTRFPILPWLSRGALFRVSHYLRSALRKNTVAPIEIVQRHVKLPDNTQTDGRREEDIARRTRGETCRRVVRIGVSACWRLIPSEFRLILNSSVSPRIDKRVLSEIAGDADTPTRFSAGAQATKNQISNP